MSASRDDDVNDGRRGIPHTIAMAVPILAVAVAAVAAVAAWLMSYAKEPDGTGPDLSTGQHRLFTPEMLAEHVSVASGLYLAILGDVFDVGTGAKHYAKGKSYHHFAGRDASRAFATGDYTPEGLTDDVAGMALEEIQGIAEWHGFFAKHETYVPVGRVVGRHYDARGEPLGAFPWETLKQHKELKEARKQQMPDCNSRWSQADGSTVWCTTRSGGVERPWVGVPRLYNQALDPAFSTPSGIASAPAPEASAAEKCVCVPPGEGADGVPYLRIYPGCQPDSATCNIVK